MDFLNILTKSSKLIATLGVVAGLGVAALPLGSVFATGPAVTGDVQVDVQVQPAIAMTISGNNDNGAHKQAGDLTTFGDIDVFNDGTNTTGTVEGHTVDGTKSSNVSSSYASLLPNASVHGGTTTGFTDFASTITVYTNEKAGYTLGISAPGALTNENSTTIPATGLVKAGTAGWGYAVDTAVTADAEGSTPNYAYQANSSIKTTDEKTGTSGSVTTVYYGVSTTNAQETGIYKTTLTYTATAD